MSEKPIPITLSALLKERERLDAVISKALEREYPVGSLVQWMHGRSWQDGRVTEHWGTMLRARNVNTGRYKNLDASAVIWYAEHQNG